ncbi:MAG: hypothetical protein ABIR81_05965 [Ginsengibacter sp.]
MPLLFLYTSISCGTSSNRYSTISMSFGICKGSNAEGSAAPVNIEKLRLLLY